MGGESVAWTRCLALAGRGDQKAVERERGGNLRTRVEVSRGIPWIYPREKARRKVDREGDPKQRRR